MNEFEICEKDRELCKENVYEFLDIIENLLIRMPIERTTLSEKL